MDSLDIKGLLAGSNVFDEFTFHRFNDVVGSKMERKAQVHWFKH